MNNVQTFTSKCSVEGSRVLDVVMTSRREKKAVKIRGTGKKQWVEQAEIKQQFESF